MMIDKNKTRIFTINLKLCWKKSKFLKKHFTLVKEKARGKNKLILGNQFIKKCYKIKSRKRNDKMNNKIKVLKTKLLINITKKNLHNFVDK